MRDREMKKAYFYETRLGRFMIAEEGTGITDVVLIRENEPYDTLDQYTLQETPLIREAAGQLLQYLEGNLRKFSVKLDPKGTLFQRKVWDALLAIPYGETRSYKEIAEAVGNKNAARAVGMANHRNPIMCIIPCHRVIGADGGLVGYGGGLGIKKQLLELENASERK